MDDQRAPYFALALSALIMNIINFVAHVLSADPNNFEQKSAKASVVDAAPAAAADLVVDVDSSAGTGTGSGSGAAETPDDFNAWERIARNGRESLPLHYAVMICAVFMQEGTAASGSKTTKLRDPVTALVYMHLAFRLLFTVLYVQKIQPWRSICFIASSLCVVCLSIIAVIGGGQLAAE